MNFDEYAKVIEGDERNLFIRLLIVHPNADPNLISQNLKLSPNYSHKIGMPRINGSGKRLSGTFEDSRWSYRVEYTTTEQGITTHLEDFLKRVTVNRDYYKTLRLEGAEVSVNIALLDGYFSDLISAGTLAFLADLGIGLGITCYPFD